MNSYKDTVEWMFQQLPMYQRVGKQAFKKDLTNTLKLAEHLGHPENKFKSIHVGGTNGKGSVSHMIASVFQSAGYKTGLYTSPHLKDFRERIKINGQVISEEEVIAFIKKNKSFLKDTGLSFFEMTVGMAFDYFANEKVDIAIIEVGMGGRLDSTNIIKPELAVITNIAMDHTDYLGETLAEIAGEKAGIIKNKIPIIIGEKQKETTLVFQKTASALNAPLTFAEKDSKISYHTDLKGNYQKKNLQTVCSSLMILKTQGWNLSEEVIINGLNNVKLHTGLQGRWEVLKEKPRVICDTAHNEAGLKLVLKQLKNEKFENLHIVLGVVNDKDLTRILPNFPVEARYYFCKPDVPRGKEAKALSEEALNYNLKGEIYSSVSEAFSVALEEALDEDLIFIGGSNFTVAEVI